MTGSPQLLIKPDLLGSRMVHKLLALYKPDKKLLSLLIHPYIRFSILAPLMYGVLSYLGIIFQYLAKT
ncbi:MAG: hypothetical protein EBR82_85295, partial [Caulobacteraceae bacterium]|nr:hypothetical protein [Caulobacteraceae bacterium]